MGHVLSRDESGQRPLEEVTGQQRIRRPTGLDRTLRGMATLFSDIRFWDVVCGLAMGGKFAFPPSDGTFDSNDFSGWGVSRWGADESPRIPRVRAYLHFRLPKAIIS